METGEDHAGPGRAALRQGRTGRCGPLRATTVAALLMVMPAGAVITRDQAKLAMDAWAGAFMEFRDDGTYSYSDTSRAGYEDFWKSCETIEVVIDAHEATGQAWYLEQALRMCDGFIERYGTDYSWNGFNDDVMWSVLFMNRLHDLVGDPQFLAIAEANFNMAFDRGWSDDLGGGLFWNTDNSGKNAATNCPATIAALNLHRQTGDPDYLAKAQDILAWTIAVLYNDDGRISDGIGTDGSVNGAATTYNQGTFIGACSRMSEATGDPGFIDLATRAADYTMIRLSGDDGILPAGTWCDDCEGFTGILARHLCRFVADHGLRSRYGSWIEHNIAAAWNARNSRHLIGSDWLVVTDEDDVDAFGATCAVSLMLNAIPLGDLDYGGLAPGGLYRIENVNSGKSIDGGAGAPNGTECVVDEWQNAARFKWVFADNGDGTFRILNLDSGRCLEQGETTASGDPCFVWDYHGAAWQRWRLLEDDGGSYRITNVHSGKLIDCFDGADGSVVYIWDDAGLPWQRWRLLPVGGNSSPVFPAVPIAMPAAREGETFAGSSLAGSAADPDAGQSLSFSKVAGPDWLTVAGDGGLGGTPTVPDAGINRFTVRATDPAGSSGDATLEIVVRPQDGLQARWGFDDAAGDTAHDTAGGGLDGSLVNGPVWTAGRLGGALEFSASARQCVEVPDGDGLNPDAAMSIAAWIRADDWDGNRRLLQKGGDRAQYRLLAEFGEFKFELGEDALTVPLPDTGRWIHLAATYDGLLMKLYFDGELQGLLNVTGAVPATTDPLFIGTKHKDVTVDGDYFDGAIDDLRIHRHALSPQAIAELHCGPAPLPLVISTSGGGPVLLEWQAHSGYEYRIESRAGLPANWTYRGSVIGPANFVSLPLGDERVMFFRVIGIGPP